MWFALPPVHALCSLCCPLTLPSCRYHHPFHFLNHNITRISNFGAPPGGSEIEIPSLQSDYCGSGDTDSDGSESETQAGSEENQYDSIPSESAGRSEDNAGIGDHELRAAAHAAVAELKVAAAVLEEEEAVVVEEEVQAAAAAVDPPADVCGGTGKVCGDSACTACASYRFFMISSHMRPEVAAGYYHEPERCRCGGNHGYGLKWPVMYNNWRKRVEAKGGPLVRIVPHFVSGQYIGAKLIALVDFAINDIICEVFGWVMRVWELLLYHRRDVRAGIVASGLLPPFTYAMNDDYALSKPLRSVKAKTTRGLVSEVLLASFFNVLCPLKYSFYLRVMVSLGQLELVHVVVPCLVRWLPAYPLSPFSL